MKCMRPLVLLLACSASVSLAADLSGVRNVYLLKMGKGMDQYLANRLTNQHLFQIVTDPKLADAILTDQIGEGFQSKFNELYPPPEPPKPEKPEAEEKDAKPEAKPPDGAPEMIVALTDTTNKLPAINSGFGHAKGMFFIVDVKSKEVVWSTYSLPKDATSKELDRTANDIVSRLMREMKKK